MKKAALHNLGCKVHAYETEAMQQLLEQAGYEIVPFTEQADVYVINTCSVTNMADRKSRQMLHKAKKENPDSIVVAAGCYVQTSSEEAARDLSVDIIIGNDKKHELVELIENCMNQKKNANEETEGVDDWKENICDINEKGRAYEALSISRTEEHTRAFLKVQDGCNYFCTYCTIPYARGFSRNPSIASLVEQAEQAAAEGGKEIVLTGVNIGDFGETTNERFVDLVKALDKVEGIKRYRISSIEPDLLDDELIEYCAHSRAFMPHFHIPLQSGSDEVLRLMHRRYDTALFAHKINLIKKVMPDAFIGVDVMVGTRGEKPELFEETYNFLQSLDVTQLHVFPYSERPGTMALKIPYVVSDGDKKLRSKRLLDMSDNKTHAFYERFIGYEAEVLFEKAARGRAMHGFTKNYIRVELPPSPDNDRLDNQLVKVKLGDFNHDKTALKALL